MMASVRIILAPESSASGVPWLEPVSVGDDPFSSARDVVGDPCGDNDIVGTMVRRSIGGCDGMTAAIAAGVGESVTGLRLPFQRIGRSDAGAEGSAKPGPSWPGRGGEWSLMGEGSSFEA